MAKAPERIWAWGYGPYGLQGWINAESETPRPEGVEYVHIDRIEVLEARVERLTTFADEVFNLAKECLRENAELHQKLKEQSDGRE